MTYTSQIQFLERWLSTQIYYAEICMKCRSLIILDTRVFIDTVSRLVKIVIFMEIFIMIFNILKFTKIAMTYWDKRFWRSQHEIKISQFSLWKCALISPLYTWMKIMILFDKLVHFKGKWIVVWFIISDRWNNIGRKEYGCS